MGEILLRHSRKKKDKQGKAQMERILLSRLPRTGVGTTYCFRSRAK